MNNSNMNYNDDEYKKIQQERKRRAKARELRKKKMRRRRMIFYALVILIIVLIIKLFSAVKNDLSSNEDITVSEINLPIWFLQQNLREKDGHSDNSKAPHNTMNEKMFIAYDNATGLKKHLVKGSNHVTTASDYAYDTKEIRQYIRGEKIYKGRQKLVFLSFDDGPNTVITPQVLSILEKNDVHATFFVVGKNIVPSHYKILKKALMDGNAIGLHSFSHDYETLYPGRTANEAKILEEARLTEGRLQKVFGKNFHSGVWRYPGGHMSWHNLDSSDSALESDGIEWIDWNTLNGDAERKAVRPTNTQEQIDYLAKSLHQNVHSDVAVVLMHDAVNKQLTADSLQSIINYFKDNNYKFCILK